MPCVCQYEYTNIVPSNGTKIVRLGYLFTYVDEVLDMQGEAESSIFSISYPVTHVAPILGRTLSVVLGLGGSSHSGGGYGKGNPGSKNLSATSVLRTWLIDVSRRTGPGVMMA